MQLQKNELYVYNLHINWDELSYVTCLDTFIDLKPRISEECYSASLSKTWILQFGSLPSSSALSSSVRSLYNFEFDHGLLDQGLQYAIY